MKNKTKESIILLIVLVLLLMYVASMAIGAIKESLKNYEYAKDGVIGESKECYQNEDGECFCKIEGNYLYVDNYYEVIK